MKLVKTLLATAALAATFGASATVDGSRGGNTSDFLSLASTVINSRCMAPRICTLDGVATIADGTIYHSDQPFADIPSSTILDGNFLAAGPTSSMPSVMSFMGGGVDYVSFLWGSPDLYNTLTVNSSVGPAQVFDVSSLGFAVTNGDQSFSQYVQFVATAGLITSLVFSNTSMTDAFEVANFSVTTPVPEPETYALMLAGLGALGYIARRRKRA